MFEHARVFLWSIFDFNSRPSLFGLFDNEQSSVMQAYKSEILKMENTFVIISYVACCVFWYIA
jgi:hypothetical protein